MVRSSAAVAPPPTGGLRPGLAKLKVSVSQALAVVVSASVSHEMVPPLAAFSTFSRTRTPTAGL